MKFYLSCASVFAIFLFFPNTISGQHRFRRDDTPAPPAPPAPDGSTAAPGAGGKECFLCEAATCDDSTKIDCGGKTKMTDTLKNAKALEAFKKILAEDDATKYGACIRLKVDDIVVKGCAPGAGACQKVFNDSCTECALGAEPICNKEKEEGNPTGPDSNSDDGKKTTKASGSFKISLDLSLCFWIICAAAFKQML